MSSTEVKTDTNESKDDMLPNETILGKLRREYKPIVPDILKDLTKLTISKGKNTQPKTDQNAIKKLFPLTYGFPIININSNDNSIATDDCIVKIGVVLSGGQASGGHNVITGLFDALKEMNIKNELYGFLNGPIGIMKSKYKKLEKNYIDKYRNTGGFDMICAGRDKIESIEQQNEALKTVNDLNLDGLVVIGGDDSNTNAAILSEFFAKNKSKCVCIGVPKTIDGDLQNEYIEISFGFDTAVKTYSEMISNICRDSKSAKKAWHFVKLMGRDASHVTIDCAIQTHPNITLIGEYIQSENLLLHDVTENICDIIAQRAIKFDKNYGVVLIPEGVIQFIPSMKALISQLTDMLKKGSPHLKKVEAMAELSDKIAYVKDKLAKISKTSLQNFNVLPRDIQAQLLLERDPHGNIQMSQIPIEQLFMLICQQKLKEHKEYSKKYKFRGNGHFFGYDGRSCYPSNFDANYCYSLGIVSGLLVKYKLNGYISRVYNLEYNPINWKAGGVPITSLLNMEYKYNKLMATIKKHLVNVDDGKKWEYFSKYRPNWALNDDYICVGPIQFYGPKILTDIPPYNIILNKTGNITWPVN